MPALTTLKRTLEKMDPSYKKAIAKKIHLSLACDVQDVGIDELCMEKAFAILGRTMVRQRLLNEALELIQNQSRYHYIRVIPKELKELKENCDKLSELSMKLAKAFLYKEHEDETAVLVPESPNADTARPAEPAQSQT